MIGCNVMTRMVLITVSAENSETLYRYMYKMYIHYQGDLNGVMKTLCQIFISSNDKTKRRRTNPAPIDTENGKAITDRKYPKNTFKKGHKMVKNQNFEKLLEVCLDIDLKIIFSKHYIPMPKTMYMR